MNKLQNKIIISETLVDANGETIKINYEIGNFLGQGSFAKCYEIKQEGSNEVKAVKIISKERLNKSQNGGKLLMNEITLHKQLSHENIVRLYHYFQDDDYYYIILELCPNKSMVDLLKKRRKIHELEVRYFVSQICTGLKYLQAKQIVHRDLKLGNLFIDENMRVKLGDFGLATKVEGNGLSKKTLCGTPNYVAPEMLNATGHSYQVDIWALGGIMYALIVGRPAFETNNLQKTYYLIKQGKFSFPDNV